MAVEGSGARFAEALAGELAGQLAYGKIRGTTLASRAQLKQSSVSDWLRGRSAPPLHFAYVACSILGVEVADLFRMAESRMQSPRPMLMTGHLERRPPSDLSPKALRERGELFVDCIAAVLKVQLADDGFTMWQAGPATGHSRVAAGQWLRGERAVPAQFAFEVCALIGLEIGELAVLAEARMSQFEQSAAITSPQSDRRA